VENSTGGAGGNGGMEEQQIVLQFTCNLCWRWWLEVLDYPPGIQVELPGPGGSGGGANGGSTAGGTGAQCRSTANTGGGGGGGG
jgi:hypothetical protein